MADLEGSSKATTARGLLKTRIIVYAAVGAVFLVGSGDVGAQGTQADYERAMHLREITANRVFRDRVRPNWLADNTRFWYRNDWAEEKREYILVDAESGTREPAFDHARLAAALAEATGEAVDADHLDIGNLEFDETGSPLQFTGYGKRWTCDLNSYELSGLADDEQRGASLTPRAQIRRSRRTGEETSITFINRT